MRNASALFLGTLLAFGAAGEVAIRTSGRLDFAHPVSARRPFPPGRWYMDLGPGADSFSHTVLYHGIGESIAQARRAHLLLVGNSKALFAFRYPVMDDFAARHGIRYFNLAFGHIETDAFPRRILERHNLRPPIVMANADLFFTGVPSGRAQRELDHSGFATWKRGIESRGEYVYQVHLRRVLPHFFPSMHPAIDILGEGKPYVVLRSSLHGSWHVWGGRDRRIPVHLDGGRTVVSPEEREAAFQFRDFVRRRGGALVLTHIPSAVPRGSWSRARTLAQTLEVPFLAPRPAGLLTEDRVHLNAESADRFATLVLEELQNIEAFQRLVAQGEAE